MEQPRIYGKPDDWKGVRPKNVLVSPRQAFGRLVKRRRSLFLALLRSHFSGIAEDELCHQYQLTLCSNFPTPPACSNFVRFPASGTFAAIVVVSCRSLASSSSWFFPLSAFFHDHCMPSSVSLPLFPGWLDSFQSGRNGCSLLLFFHFKPTGLLVRRPFGRRTKKSRASVRKFGILTTPRDPSPTAQRPPPGAK